jgi:hypothetical protein
MSERQILLTSLFSLASAIVAGTVAALTVHWLTLSRERAAWIRDRQMEEWRELLSEFAQVYVFLLSLGFG